MRISENQDGIPIISFIILLTQQVTCSGDPAGHFQELSERHLRYTHSPTVSGTVRKCYTGSQFLADDIFLWLRI